MRWRYRIGLVLAFILQIGLLGWLIADRAMLLRNGTEIRLAVVPIDPRDLFRGEYVTLRYDISRLYSTQLDGDDDFERADAVYVAMAKDESGWRPAAMTHVRPANGVALKGTVTDANTCVGAENCHTYDVAYDIERFFVPEGVGRELEKVRNDHGLSVDIAVSEDGRAALKRLLVDGEVRYEEELY